MDETMGISVFPSVKASTETSGPSRYSSITTLSPLLPNLPPCIISVIVCMASSRLSAIITPLPRASPSALITMGRGAFSAYRSASSILLNVSKRAVGILYFFMRFLEKTLLPSIIAASARGPKQGIPAASSASTHPSTRGSSGVTTA